MALMRTQGEVPGDAIALGRSDAVTYQWQMIQSWPDKKQTWPFRWGNHALAAFAGLTGMYINNRYRMKLKLLHYGFVTTSFPMIIGPAMFATGFHAIMATNGLLIGETKCSLCAQYNAAIAQIGSAIVYPMILSPIANFMYALRHATYKLPYWKDTKETIRLWWTFTKPMGKPLLVLACLHAVAASMITYYEAQKIDEIQMVLQKHHERAEKQKAERMAKAKFDNSNTELK